MEGSRALSAASGHVDLVLVLLFLEGLRPMSEHRKPSLEGMSNTMFGLAFFYAKGLLAFILGLLFHSGKSSAQGVYAFPERGSSLWSSAGLWVLAIVLLTAMAAIFRIRYVTKQKRRKDLAEREFIEETGSRELSQEGRATKASRIGLVPLGLMLSAAIFLAPVLYMFIVFLRRPLTPKEIFISLLVATLSAIALGVFQKKSLAEMKEQHEPPPEEPSNRKP